MLMSERPSSYDEINAALRMHRGRSARPGRAFCTRCGIIWPPDSHIDSFGGSKMQTLHLSSASQYIAGILLITVVTIEVGGWYMTTIVRGMQDVTPFQATFARAGHAHAGVLVSLSLICLLFADAAALDGFFGWVARLGVPLAAILLPGGFFASSAGRGVTRPNRFFPLVWAGAAALAIGVLSLGIGLLLT